MSREQTPGAEVAVRAEELSKRSDARSDRFEPTISLLHVLRGKRPIGHLASAGADDDDDADDDEDEVDEGHVPSVRATGEAWALRDVSFAVPHGVGLGVLGDRDASASTLLRILTGMTLPTAGRVVLRGRVAPPPELSLALMRKELAALDNVRMIVRLLRGERLERGHAERIVSFALDGARRAEPATVLRRLALSMSLLLDSDVVLMNGFPQVGDSGFAALCEQRLKELVAGGCALVLASPDDALLERFCDQCLVLRDGRVAALGETSAVLDTYRRRRADEQLEAPHAPAVQARAASFNFAVALLSAFVEDDEGQGAADAVSADSDIGVIVELETALERVALRPTLVLTREDGLVSRFPQDEERVCEQPGLYRLGIRLPAGAVADGLWSAEIELAASVHGETMSPVRRRTPAFAVEPSVAPVEAGAPESDESVGLADADAGGAGEWTLRFEGPG